MPKAQFRAQLERLLGPVDFYPTAIEQQFPHILEKIILLWNSDVLDAYLSDLMMPDRIDRQGFPPDVAREIFKLSTIHSGMGLGQGSSGTGWEGANHGALFRTVFDKD